MIVNYKRIENQRKNKKLVIALRGNIFLDPKCDLKEQFVIPDDQYFSWF